MLVRNLSIHEGTNNCQEPFGSLKEQMFVRKSFKFHEGTNARQEPLEFLKVQLDMNLPSPWEDKVQCCMLFRNFSTPWRFQVEQEPPESMGGSKLMSNDTQELFNSWKLKDWRGTSRLYGRFKLDVQCGSVTSQSHEISKFLKNLSIP